MPGPMVIAVSGSARPENFTFKALSYVVDELTQTPGFEVQVVDLRTLALAPAGAPETPEVTILRDKVRACTGLILATPEYHGSFSSAIKLFIENMGFPSVLAGKPVSLLGVAAGQLGAVKALEHLRSVCSHIGALVLPGSTSIPLVQQMFDASGKVLDSGLETRLRGQAHAMADYIRGAVCPRLALEELARRGDTTWMSLVAPTAARQ